MSNSGARFPVTAETLAGTELLADLSLAERAAIAERCVGRSYPVAQQVAASGAPQRDVHFIVSGRVKVAVYSKSGREVVFRTMESGEMFGELSAIDGAPRSASVQTIEPTLIVSLPPQDFLEVVAQFPSVGLRVMKHLTRLVRLLSQRVFEHDALKVGSRIQSELLRLAAGVKETDNEAEISPAPTDEYLARLVGTNRAAVNREMSLMRRAKLIRKRRDALRILDLRALRALVGRQEHRYVTQRGERDEVEPGEE